jgi:hypothetical protein
MKKQNPSKLEHETFSLDDHMALIEKRPTWLEDIRHALEGNWRHHGPCSQISLKSLYDDETCNWLIVAAPVNQEIVGGDKDGLKVWTGFAFDLTSMMGLFGMPGLAIQGIEARSRCVDCTPAPMIELRCRLGHEKVVIQLHLEPVADSPVVEIIDTFTFSLREPRRTCGQSDHQR